MIHHAMEKRNVGAMHARFNAGRSGRPLMNAIERSNYNHSLELAFKLARLFDIPIGDIFIYEEEQNKGKR